MVIPQHSSLQTKPPRRVKCPIHLQSKFLFTSSCSTKHVLWRRENLKKKKRKKKRLTVVIYLGRHQWDFLRGKETVCELNVYLLRSSSKLGVYPFKQQQEPIHLFLPDCPCFFWHAIAWKWLRWSAVGGPGLSISFSRKKQTKNQTKKPGDGCASIAAFYNFWYQFHRILKLD